VTTLYIDASALTKLILDEPHSAAMRRWWIESDRAICSRVGLIETARAVSRWQPETPHLRAILDAIAAVELDVTTADRAASVGPPGLRTLDAIHLATAMRLIDDLDGFVTYDDRLAAAAREAGLPVVRPA